MVLGDKFSVGVGILYDGVSNPILPIFSTGLELKFGIRFSLAAFFTELPPVLGLRITPILGSGVDYQGVTRNGHDIFKGFAFHITPSLRADMRVPFSEALRVGLEVGYNFYLSEYPLQNLGASLFASWKI